MKNQNQNNLINSLVEKYITDDNQKAKKIKLLNETIPLRFKEANLFNTTKYIQEYYTNNIFEKKGIYLYGNSGSGKTYSIYALTMYLIINNLSVCVFNLSTLLNNIRLSYHTENVYVDKLFDVDILIIDDIGKEKVSDWVSEQLYTLINTRYENMKTTIFTSNLSLDELADKVGYDSIVSRIYEMCEVYELIGEDRRLNKKL